MSSASDAALPGTNAPAPTADPLSRALSEAAALRRAMDAQSRTWFDTRIPEFLQHTLFHREDADVQRLRSAGTNDLVSFSRALRHTAREAFSHGEVTAALHMYERALSLFWYVDNSDPDWRKNGVRDEYLKEVRVFESPAWDAADTDALRKQAGNLLRNISLCNSRSGHHDAAVAAAAAAVDLLEDDVKSLLRHASALMDHPGTGTDAVELAAQQVARAQKLLSDKHAVGHGSERNVDEDGAGQGSLQALADHLAARIERELQRSARTLAGAVRGFTTTEAKKPDEGGFDTTPARLHADSAAISAKTGAPVAVPGQTALNPPDLVAHAAAAGINLQDPRVRRELARLEERASLKRRHRSVVATQGAELPIVNDPSLRRMLNEVQCMGGEELDQLLRILQLEASAADRADTDALRKRVTDAIVSIETQRAAAKLRRQRVAFCVRWVAIALIAGVVLFRVVILLTAPTSSRSER